MEKTRYDIGLEKLSEIDGRGGEAVISSLESISPDLGRYIAEFAFGDIYSRGTLSMQEREAVTLACLLASGGCEPQLDVHINGALNTGIPPEKIIEIFLQCIPYTGFPRVLNAVFEAKRVFSERAVELTPKHIPNP